MAGLVNIDLAGTKWLLKSRINHRFNFTANVNFTYTYGSTSLSCTQLKSVYNRWYDQSGSGTGSGLGNVNPGGYSINVTVEPSGEYIVQNRSSDWAFMGWTEPATTSLFHNGVNYITFDRDNVGEDAENATLISWLSTNAIPCELTDTTWLLKSSATHTASGTQYDIFYEFFDPWDGQMVQANRGSFPLAEQIPGIGGSNVVDYIMCCSNWLVGSSIPSGDLYYGQVAGNPATYSANTYAVNDDAAENGARYETGLVIHITGGADAQNAALVQWLTDNATQTPTVSGVWNMEDTWSGSWWEIPARFGNFAVNGRCGLYRFNGFCLGYLGKPDYQSVTSHAGGVAVSNGTGQDDVYTVGGGTERDYQYISFTDGADVAAAKLVCTTYGLGHKTDLVYANLPTSLQKTKWQLKPDLGWVGGFTFPATFSLGVFTAYNRTFTSFSMVAGSIYDTRMLKYDSTQIAWRDRYDTAWTWPNAEYQVVTFTTGVDTQNFDLIGWLSENATRLTLSQLATPTNVSVNGTRASFAGVPNATRYKVLIGGNSIGSYGAAGLYSVSIAGWNALTMSDSSFYYSTDGGINWIPIEHGHSGLLVSSVSQIRFMVDGNALALCVVSDDFTTYLTSAYSGTGAVGNNYILGSDITVVITDDSASS